MRRISIVLILVTAALAFPASSPASSPAATVVRSCDHAVDFNLKIISARNMRCRVAERIMRSNDKPIARNFTVPRGFRCKLKEGIPLSGIWRCTRADDKAFRFVFGD